MSGKRVADVARQTDAAVAEAQRRARAAGDVVDAFTPLDALIQQQEGECSEEFAIRFEGFVAALEYFFAEGPHPQVVMQRVYGTVRAVRPHLTLNMPGRALAAIFGQSKGAEATRTRLLITRTFEQAGYRTHQMPYQKAEGTREVYAAAQLGNTHRKGTGKKTAKRKISRRGGKVAGGV